jgi:hypothetical protein
MKLVNSEAVYLRIRTDQMQHMESKYTRIETVVPIVPCTIKADLTPGLGKRTFPQLILLQAG